jgi:hypothetical protein
MIHSQPKSSLMISIGIFLMGTLAVAIWLLVGLMQNPASYFWVKLILAPSLLVIGITVAAKTYFSALILTVGDNRLTYRTLIGSEKRHKITAIVHWEEEVVKSKTSEYRRLSMLLDNGKKLQLSNHENSNYKDVINYLKKKVKKRK